MERKLLKQPPEIESTPAKPQFLWLPGPQHCWPPGYFGKVSGLLTLGVTARLLSPEDFGVAAYFLIATALLEMLQRQIAIVLIRLDDVTQEHLETTFTFQVIFGLATATLFFLSQPLVALIGIPELVQLTPALSALAFTIAFRSPKFILFERKLRFRIRRW